MVRENEYIVLCFPYGKENYILAARVISARKYRLNYGPAPTTDNVIGSGASDRFAFPWTLPITPTITAEQLNTLYFTDKNRLLIVKLDDGIGGIMPLYGKTDGTSTSGDFPLVSPMLSTSVSTIEIEAGLLFKLWSIKVHAVDQSTTIKLMFRKEDDTTWNELPLISVAAGEEYETIYRKPIILKAPGLRGTDKKAKKLQIKFSWEQATAGTAVIEAEVSIGEEGLGDKPLRWYLAFGDTVASMYAGETSGTTGAEFDYLKTPFTFFVLPEMTGMLEPRFSVYNPTNMSFYAHITFDIDDLRVKWISKAETLYNLMVKKIPAIWLSGHEKIPWVSYPFLDKLGVSPAPLISPEVPMEAAIPVIEAALRKPLKM